ncbi:MAG: aldehyde dehydrogenase family protein, partial [Sphingomonadales bacterium]
MDVKEILTSLGMNPADYTDGDLEVTSPIDGSLIARVHRDTAESLDRKIGLAAEAFEVWRQVPAPARGELVRRLGNKLRQKKEALGALVTMENGKLLQEGLGEVQEMIDIC